MNDNIWGGGGFEQGEAIRMRSRSRERKKWIKDSQATVTSTISFGGEDRSYEFTLTVRPVVFLFKMPCSDKRCGVYSENKRGKKKRVHTFEPRKQ